MVTRTPWPLGVVSKELLLKNQSIFQSFAKATTQRERGEEPAMYSLGLLENIGLVLLSHT